MFYPTQLVEYSTIPNDGPSRKLSSTQIELPELRVPILRWCMRNLHEDQYSGDGMETRPHVTLFYGLDIGTDSKVLREIASWFGKPISLAIGKLKSFSHSPEFDVLWASVVSSDMKRLNAELRKLPNGNRYPEYIPHMTVAYLKKGEAAQYVGRKVFGGRFARTGFSFSKTDYSEEFISTTPFGSTGLR